MACNAAGLVDKTTPGSPKLDELASILEETCQLAGLKAVVFSQWAHMGELVELRVRRMGLDCMQLHGGVPSTKRGDLMGPASATTRRARFSFPPTPAARL